MSEEKKVPVELSEEELEFVDGGAYTQAEWFAMTPAERVAAKQRSIKARAEGTACEMD